MASARAFVDHHGPIEEWTAEMGMKKSSMYNYKTALLKEGTFKYLAPKALAPRTQRLHRQQERQNSTAWKIATPQPEPEIIEAEFTTTQQEQPVLDPPSWDEINAGLAVKNSEHIIQTVSTLNGLLDFVVMGDALTDEAHQALSILYHRLSNGSTLSDRPFEIDLSN